MIGVTGNLPMDVWDLPCINEVDQSFVPPLERRLVVVVKASRRRAVARAYSGVLGSVALCFVILRGIYLGTLPNEILVQALVVFGTFAALGFCIGWIADQTVCDSVENRFRSEMARIHAVVASNSENKSDAN